MVFQGNWGGVWLLTDKLERTCLWNGKLSPIPYLKSINALIHRELESNLLKSLNFQPSPLPLKSLQAHTVVKKVFKTPQNLKTI